MCSCVQIWVLSGLILLHRFRRAGVFGSCTVRANEESISILARNFRTTVTMTVNSCVRRVKKMVTRVEGSRGGEIFLTGRSIK